MGMAASQARYLGLTARKSNVEYEGQQINQARTALANQSANLFNQMLTMEVPTAPDTTEFTTVQYSYKDGVYTETIDEMYELSDQTDGYNYLVTHYHYADVYTGVKEIETNPEVYMVAGNPPTPITTTIANGLFTKSPADVNTAANSLTVDGMGSFTSVTSGDPSLDADLQTEMDALGYAAGDKVWYYNNNGFNQFITDTDLTALNGNAGEDDLDLTSLEKQFSQVGNYDLSLYDPTDSIQAAEMKQIRNDWPELAGVPNNQIYRYEEFGVNKYVTYDDLMTSFQNQQDPRFTQENQERLATYNAQAINTRIEETERARIQVNGKGRWETVNYEDSSAIYTLTTESVTDEDAYNAAMNQYTHDVQVYDKAVSDINAKTEIIQAEDRTLELRLKQLDTEQKALQTEMEAVAKVIQKNVETTFKTFGS